MTLIWSFWIQVVEKCRRGRYQPLLLLFATPNGTPVDASDAPKAVTLVDKPAMSVCNKPPIQRCSLSPNGGNAMGGRRSLTPSPEKSPHCNDLTQRRAITPNPEPPIGQVSIYSLRPVYLIFIKNENNVHFDQTETHDSEQRLSELSSISRSYLQSIQPCLWRTTSPSAVFAGQT